MSKFKIPVEYAMCGLVEVDAESLEKAKLIAMDANLTEVVEQQYIDGSFDINEDMVSFFNPTEK